MTGAESWGFLRASTPKMQEPNPRRRVRFRFATESASKNAKGAAFRNPIKTPPRSQDGSKKRSATRENARTNAKKRSPTTVGKEKSREKKFLPLRRRAPAVRVQSKTRETRWRRREGGGWLAVGEGGAETERNGGLPFALLSVFRCERAEQAGQMIFTSNNYCSIVEGPNYPSAHMRVPMLACAFLRHVIL